MEIILTDTTTGWYYVISDKNYRVMIDPIELPENDTLVQKYKNALSVEVDIQMCDDLIQLLEARRIEYEKLV